MAEDFVIRADLSRLSTVVQNLDQNVVLVSKQVEQVGTMVGSTQQELAELRQQLRDFELRYQRSTEVGLAETRLVKVRQELEHTFGHHDEVRRTATGILQASDISIVSQQTVNSITEEMMLQAPRYWLAPALVALAAWMRDDRPLAEKALAEALRRDDGKTALFFALICRRAGKNAACATWLDRYLGQQDPRLLSRQTVVLIDATAGGVFSVDVQTQCQRRFQAWLEELANQAGFIEDQRQQWRAALRSRLFATDRKADYPQLAATSATWLKLEEALNRAALNADLLGYLKSIFETPLAPVARLADAVDAQLDRLVTDHDTAELPLRREEAMLQLVIDEGGRIDEAHAKHDLEQQALEAEVSFTQLLTNAAMHAEKSGATLASQRLALALSRDWLRDAHADLTLETRTNLPASVELAIGDWHGTTADGSEEPALIESLEQHIASAEQDALDAVKLGNREWAAVAFGGFLVFTVVWGWWLAALLGVAALGWVFFEYQGLEKRRQAVRDAYEARRVAQTAMLRGCLAEVVEWRRAFAAADAQAADTTAYIEAIVPDSQLAAPHDGGRRIAIDAA